MAHNKSKIKTIPIKNYVILAFVFLAVAFLVVYLCRWYDVYSDYKRETPVIRGTLSYEITTLDLDHYILENPTTVIYMCTSKDDVCRNYEKDFKKLIVKEQLQDNIIYLNLTDADLEKFVDDFNNRYPYKIKLTKTYPAIVIFDQDKITDLLQGTKNKELTVSKTKQFLDINKIGD